MPADATAPVIPGRARLKLFLILDSAFTVLAAPLALFWGMMSVMASTTTTDMAWANTYALINLSLPVAMVLCVIGGWVAYGLRRQRTAWIIILLPLLWLAASIAMMAMWPAR